VPDVNLYVHPSKTVTWALVVDNPPEFAKKNQNLDERTDYSFKQGEYIKPFLKNFYERADFEKYYKETLPKLDELVSAFKNQFENQEIETILEKTWGRTIEQDMIVIPNPYTQGSFGPKIGGIHYQVLGVWDGREISTYDHSIIHEGSHPLAKEILDQHWDLINTKEHLLAKVQNHENYPKAYNHWQICFEEHLIRAVHKGVINPNIKENYNVEEALQKETDKNGMILIKKFYEGITATLSIEKAIPVIISRL